MTPPGKAKSAAESPAGGKKPDTPQAPRVVTSPNLGGGDLGVQGIRFALAFAKVDK